MHGSFAIFNVWMWSKCDRKFEKFGNFVGTEHSLPLLTSSSEWWGIIGRWPWGGSSDPGLCVGWKQRWGRLLLQADLNSGSNPDSLPGFAGIFFPSVNQYQKWFNFQDSSVMIYAHYIMSRTFFSSNMIFIFSGVEHNKRT